MKKYLALFALILMQGCSSSDSNAPANNVFNLSGLQEDGTGTIYMTQPSGDDSDAIAYAGTLTTTKNKSEMLEGVLYITLAITVPELLPVLRNNTEIDRVHRLLWGGGMIR